MDADAILSTIERLAKLREAGALTDEEFAAKKADLLGRL
ncbi:MAG: SHOCT domain-containing protein [Paracoccaceae bacterium]